MGKPVLRIVPTDPHTDECLVSDLRSLAEKARQNREQQPTKFENIVPLEYDKAGDQGPDERAPTPKKKVNEDDKRAFIQASFDTLKGAELDKVFELVSKIRANAEAPKKPQWKERTTGRDVSPADWIRMHYGETHEDGTWHPGTLSRADINREDRALYLAYAKWVKRHPEKDLVLPTEDRAKEADPVKFLERHRENSRRGYHRSRGQTI